MALSYIPQDADVSVVATISSAERIKRKFMEAAETGAVVDLTEAPSTPPPRKKQDVRQSNHSSPPSTLEDRDAPPADEQWKQPNSTAQQVVDALVHHRPIPVLQVIARRAQATNHQREAFRQAGAIAAIGTAMKTHHKSAYLQEVACLVLFHLAYEHPANQQAFGRKDANLLSKNQARAGKKSISKKTT